MKKFLICLIIFFSLFFIKNIITYNNIIKTLSSSRVINNYCINYVVKERDSLLENNLYEINENNPNLKICLNLLKTSVYTNSLMIVSHYYKIKSKTELEKQIDKTQQIFANDKYFLNLYSNKYEKIKKLSEDIIKEEFPNPYEGRETPIFINLNEAELINEQKVILESQVYEYCMHNKDNRACDSVYGY